MPKPKKAVEALRRFRRLVRNVILNQSWLNDQTEQKLSGNVKRNISVLVRVRRKIGLLTMEEKSLIRTSHVVRTVDERKKLVTLMAGLQCFAHIPPKVRARLVPVIRFIIVPEGRTIIREGETPVFVYFILTGEVVASFKEYDVANNQIEKILTVCIPGDCIGDVEVMEGCPRRTSYTANSDAELLYVEEDDFKAILEPVMGKQWFEAKNCVKTIDYFDFFSDFQTICCSKIGVVHQFAPLQTVYVEDKGKLGFTYFVLSGECIIMQCLKIKVKQQGRQKSYELVPVTDEDQNIFQELDELELLRLLKGNEIFNTRTSHMDLNVDISGDEEDEDMAQIETQRRGSDIKRAYNYCAQYAIRPKAVEEKSSSIHTGNIESAESEHMFKYVDDVYKETSSLRSSSITESSRDQYGLGQPYYHQEINRNKRTTIRTEGFRPKSTKKISTTQDKDEQSSTMSEESFTSMDENEGDSFYTQLRRSTAEPFTIENHFVDVGTIGPGGVFGLGEELKHRIILANTNVQCLVVPRFWLFENEQNPGNIWQRRRFHLECTIPSREKIFDNFLNTRKWQQFKDNYIQGVLKENLYKNTTKIQDIPVVSRILEGTDSV